MAALLVGCAPPGSAGQEPSRDYSVLAAPDRAPGGGVRATGEAAELASGHLVTVDGLRSVEEPPDGWRWLHPPLGDVLVADLALAVGDPAARQLVVPDVLLPLPDGRLLRGELCVVDDATIDPLEEGIAACVDVPPALTGDIDEVHLVDRTADGTDGARSGRGDVLRWQVDVG